MVNGASFPPRSALPEGNQSWITALKNVVTDPNGIKTRQAVQYLKLWSEENMHTYPPSPLIDQKNCHFKLFSEPGFWCLTQG